MIPTIAKGLLVIDHNDLEDQLYCIEVILSNLYAYSKTSDSFIKANYDGSWYLFTNVKDYLRVAKINTCRRGNNIIITIIC